MAAFDDLVKKYTYNPESMASRSSDGPPYISINRVGTKRYYKDNKFTVLHRLDGPAVEYTDGSKFWYKDGEQHRLDGPAVIYANGASYWVVDGNELTSKEVDELKRKLAIKEEIIKHENNRIDPGMLEDYL